VDAGGWQHGDAYRLRRVAAAEPQGSDTSVFALAPILLLLHEDTVFFQSLSGTQRYAPPLAAIIASLCFSAVTHILRGPVALAAALHMLAKWPWVARNFAMLLAAAPNATCFANYLWSYARVSSLTLMMLAPLNVLCVVASDLGSVRLLACVSLAAAAGQHFMQRSVRIAGMRCL